MYISSAFPYILDPSGRQCSHVATHLLARLLPLLSIGELLAANIRC